MDKLVLTIERLRETAKAFAETLSATPIPSLYGVTDGKAVGTFVEASFHEHIGDHYEGYEPGSAAKGIDFPELNVDLKVTSITQPQSSCPFRDATQKVYGLGYHLLVFVYDKSDDHDARAASLKILHAIFINSDITGDYQTTSGLRNILTNHGNLDDIDAFLQERNLPLDEIGRRDLAERIMNEPPPEGCLTISNALQWRLQYGRAITFATEHRPEGPEDLIAK